ncbi:MAG: hypothetical protein KGM47_03060 [Acidobacteriota bacterium]|nr:hypothetical protein [Acidobacteriota bacterium]
MSEHSTSAKYFIVALVAVIIAVSIYVLVEHRRARTAASAAQSAPAMTAEERNYLPELEVTSPKMSAATNFLGDTVYYLDGNLVNKGARTIGAVELKLTFMDPFGEVVLVDTRRPVTPQTTPLKAGETRSLHLIFEHLPAEWNQGPPVIAATYVSFR